MTHNPAACAGRGRRVPHTKAERVEAKRLYDADYRKKNRAMLKAKKAAYFKRTYDPRKAGGRAQGADATTEAQLIRR